MRRVIAAVVLLAALAGCADPASEMPGIRSHVRTVERVLPSGAQLVDTSSDGMNYLTDTYTVTEPYGSVRASIASRLARIGTHVTWVGAKTRMFSMVFVPGCHKSGFQVRVFLLPQAAATKIVVSGKCAA